MVDILAIPERGERHDITPGNFDLRGQCQVRQITGILDPAGHVNAVDHLAGYNPADALGVDAVAGQIRGDRSFCRPKKRRLPWSAL